MSAHPFVYHASSQVAPRLRYEDLRSTNELSGAAESTISPFMDSELVWTTHSNLKGQRKGELLRPNFVVQWAFYFSIFAIPFARLYVPGTGEHVGIKRVLQALIFAAMVSRPRVCLRFAPVALLWFGAYAFVRMLAGLWLAPEYSSAWWPSTLELFEFLLPWTWMLFNVLRYPEFKFRGLWALALGASLCALLHVAGIGVLEVDNGIDGRSSVFDQNANEIGDFYAVALVALVALGLFQRTKDGLRLAVVPAAGLVAIAMAKTGSRSAVLFSVAGILILLPQARAFMPRIKRYVTMLLIAVVFAGVMIQIPTVLKRFAPGGGQGEGTIMQREARGRMIPVLWNIFLRSPIYGSGPDRYQYELTRRAMPYMTEKQQTVSAHNLALLLLVETGVIGFFLFSVGLANALIAAWKARSGSCGFLPLAWLLPISLAGLTISSPIYAPTFWLAIAYALAGPNPELSYANRISRFQP
jgi:O-antigen ligase